MKQDPIDEYLAATGQSREDLMAGASQFGMNYIIETLIPQAMKEKKKIVWNDVDLETGQVDWSLQEL